MLLKFIKNHQLQPSKRYKHNKIERNNFILKILLYTNKIITQGIKGITNPRHL